MDRAEKPSCEYLDGVLINLLIKSREYHAYGVPYCRVIDPETRGLWEYFADDDAPAPAAHRISAKSLQILADEIFEDW
jgi:hypothetical protein